MCFYLVFNQDNIFSGKYVKTFKEYTFHCNEQPHYKRILILKYD